MFPVSCGRLTVLKAARYFVCMNSVCGLQSCRASEPTVVHVLPASKTLGELDTLHLGKGSKVRHTEQDTTPASLAIDSDNAVLYLPLTCLLSGGLVVLALVA